MADQNWTVGSAVLSDSQYLYNNDGMVTYASDSATGLTAALGGAYQYNALNQLTQYQRGAVSVSGTGSISGVTETQQLGWNPQGALIGEVVNGTTVLNNLGNAQNQNTSNTYYSNGDTSSVINAAGQGFSTVYNAWGQPVSYTITEPDITDGGTVPVGQETIQYDALGRPMGEYQTYNFPTSTPGIPNTKTTQHTLVYDANSGQVIQEINQINGQDPVRYVYGPNGNVILRAAGTNGSLAINQTLYALQGADGSTLAIADTSGNVVERYVYDGLGNVQALQADGAAYAADTSPGSTGTPGQQINEYFVGSTFDSSGNQTADGTQYNWTILYQGENQDALPGVHITPQGAFNPRQQQLLAPDLSVVQAGISAYDPRSSWGDYAAGYGITGAEIGLTFAGGFLGGPLGAIAVGSALSALNRSYLGGETFSQSIEGGIADATGITGINAAINDTDWASGQSLNLSTGGRALEGIFGALGIIGDAAGLAQASEAAGPWISRTLGNIGGGFGGGPAPASAVVGGGEQGGAAAAVGPGDWVGAPGWASGLASFAVAANEQAGSGIPNPYLEGETPVPGTRSTGVERAKRLEADLVQATGEGTLDWTPEEVDYIRQNGELPDNIVGHHINSVAQFPEWAGDPRNIMFVRGQIGNLAEHGGNFQNATSGPLIDRAAMILLAEGGGE